MIKRLFGSLFVIFVCCNAYSAECRRTGSICADTAASKMISGVDVPISVVDGCWSWKDTYECIEKTTIDNCAAIADTPGCTKNSTKCSTSAWNGTCLTYTDTYRCGNALTSTTNVKTLDNTYTITYDEIDTTPCDKYADNDSCKLSSKVCTEGPSTKTINGLEVTRDCWNWKETYSCLASNPVDYCSPLKAAGCTKLTEKCTKTAFTGECIAKTFTYKCEDKTTATTSGNLVLLDTEYTIVKDTTNLSACSKYEIDKNCSIAEQVCTDGPSTKTINGLDVYKDCWAWKYTYNCANPVLQSTCGELEANPDCTEVSSTCIDKLPDGKCGLLEHTYKCLTKTGETSYVTDCGNQMFCIDGKCFATGYPADGDFSKVITNMELMREAANYKIFAGESGSCHSNLLKNCCKSQGGGEGGRNDAIAATVATTALKVGAEAVKMWGSRYIFEGLSNAGSTMLEEYAFAALTDGTLSMTGSFSVWGAEFSISSSGISYVGFNPYMLALTIAIMVVMELMKCEKDEIALGMKRGQGLCHKVGSYCSSKVLGVCLEKKQGWCCFPSKLGRIVNEQGRAQIGKSWGEAKSPDCTGFTTAELEKLRFDKMDLSEFITDIVAGQKTEQFAVQRLQQKATSYYAQ